MKPKYKVGDWVEIKIQGNEPFIEELNKKKYFKITKYNPKIGYGPIKTRRRDYWINLKKNAFWLFNTEIKRKLSKEEIAIILV